MTYHGEKAPRCDPLTDPYFLSGVEMQINNIYLDSKIQFPSLRLLVFDQNKLFGCFHRPPLISKTGKNCAVKSTRHPVSYKSILVLFENFIV